MRWRREAPSSKLQKNRRTPARWQYQQWSESKQEKKRSSRKFVQKNCAKILAVDWIVMVYAVPIQRWLGTTLLIVAIVLGVTQVALGLQVIFKSLTMLGVNQLPPG